MTTALDEHRARVLRDAVVNLAIEAQGLGSRLVAFGGPHARQAYRVDDAAKLLCLAARAIGAGPHISALNTFFAGWEPSEPPGASQGGSQLIERRTQQGKAKTRRARAATQSSPCGPDAEETVAT